jgi:putative oxidoreductase
LVRPAEEIGGRGEWLMIENLTGTHADWVVGIARIIFGIIFFAHGSQKLPGRFGGPGLASSMRTFTEHVHLPSTLAFLVIAGEFFSGIGTDRRAI